MSNKELRERAFNESIKAHVEGAELQPSPELWQRLSQSIELGGVTAPAPKSVTLRRVVVWSSAVAAAVALYFGVSLSESAEESNQILVNEIIAEVAEPKATLEKHSTLVAIESPAKKVETKSTPQPTVAEPKTIEVEPKEEVQYPSKANEPTPSAKESKVKSEQGVTTATPTPTPTPTAPKIIRPKRQQNRGLTLALMGSGGGRGGFSGGSSYTPTPLMGVLDISNGYIERDNQATQSPQAVNAPNVIRYDHHTPLTFGLSLAYRLSERWSIESGLTYSSFRSEATLLNSSRSVDQELQFVGVPLRASYNIISKPLFTLYAATGAHLENCFSAKLDGESLSEKRWHLSAEVAVGAQYNINRWLGLYIEPEATYYITPTNLTTLRKESPLAYNVSLGLRFFFGGNKY